MVFVTLGIVEVCLEFFQGKQDLIIALHLAVLKEEHKIRVRGFFF